MLRAAVLAVYRDGALNIKDNAALQEIMAYFAEMVQEGLRGGHGWEVHRTFTTGNCTGTINGCWILDFNQTAAASPASGR
jgi:hypothetical protein